MKQMIYTAIRLTLVSALIFMGAYPLLILTFAHLSPGRGKGIVVKVNDQVLGWTLLGQRFTGDQYFQGRPSAVDYNAAGSGGSNKGPSNSEYLQLVSDRIDSFLAHNPGTDRTQIPSDLVTASGSGLDPHISVQAAYVQAKRIATYRNTSEEAIRKLVAKHIEKPRWGILGTEKVNVLELNLDLDEISRH